MAKITVMKRVWLTIEVAEPWFSLDATRAWFNRGQDAEKALKLILKGANLDGVDGSSVSLDSERGEICSLCKRDWEEDEDGPCCCEAAVDEWNKAKVQADGEGV